MSEKRIAWAMTGAGHMLEECVEVLLNLERADVFLSRAAEEVLQMYALGERIGASPKRLFTDTRFSSPVVGRFSGGSYSALVIAPATSNSVAKFVHGISDSLVTNLFAQAGKAGVPIIVFPTDLASEVVSVGPRGGSIKLYPRPIDLENTKKLGTFAGVRVVCNQQELERCLVPYL